MDNRYTVESVSTEEALSALQVDWDRLSAAAESPNVFMTFDWYRAWAQQLRGEEHNGRLQPHVLLLKQNNVVVGIVPFVRRIKSCFGFRVRKLEFVTGHADYYDFGLGIDKAILAEAVAEFLKHTSKHWDIIDVSSLRNIGNVTEFIKGAFLHAGLPHRLLVETGRYPCILIDRSWSEMKKKHLRFARRSFAAFSERASEGFRVRIVENPQQEPGLLEKLIAIEAQKHVDGRLVQPFLSKYANVFQSLFDTLGPQGWIAVVLVECDDGLVAWRFLYRCGKKLWDYLTAYDRAFSDLSPGTIAICAAIDYGFARGFNEFDFLRGEEPYKLRWTSDSHRVFRLLIWNRRWISRIHAFAFARLRIRSSASTQAKPPLWTV